jgi:predicted outer membrane protein
LHDQDPERTSLRRRSTRRADEVACHKTVNTAPEKQLIPSASNAELKSLLQTGPKIFQDHEQHAEMGPLLDARRAQSGACLGFGFWH